MSTSTPNALVTGANRGIGREICRQLAERGHHVILTARDEAKGAEAARGLREQGLDVESRPLDVADPGSISALAETLGRGEATLDVLVNNAGISLHGFDGEVARRTLDVNFFGALHVTEALLPRIVDGGVIVMVSSGLGRLSGYGDELRKRLLDPHLGRDELVELMNGFVRDVEQGRHEEAGWPSNAYGVSKAGLNALTRILARELASRDIRVNSAGPGWVRTDMGGPNASRTVEEGAASIVWAAVQENGPTGGFFRDGRRLDW